MRGMPSPWSRTMPGSTSTRTVRGLRLRGRWARASEVSSGSSRRGSRPQAVEELDSSCASTL
jgi:hypothetical protein